MPWRRPKPGEGSQTAVWLLAKRGPLADLKPCSSYFFWDRRIGDDTFGDDASLKFSSPGNLFAVEPQTAGLTSRNGEDIHIFESVVRIVPLAPFLLAKRSLGLN